LVSAIIFQMTVLDHPVNVVLQKKIVHHRDRQSNVLINAEDMEGVTKC